MSFDEAKSVALNRHQNALADAHQLFNQAVAADRADHQFEQELAQLDWDLVKSDPDHSKHDEHRAEYVRLLPGMASPSTPVPNPLNRSKSNGKLSTRRPSHCSRNSEVSITSVSESGSDRSRQNNGPHHLSHSGVGERQN
jgi:hypothetical protein